MKNKILLSSVVGSVILFLGTAGMAAPVGANAKTRFASYLSADVGHIQYADDNDSASTDNSADNDNSSDNTDLGSNDSDYGSSDSIYDYTSHIATLNI